MGRIPFPDAGFIHPSEAHISNDLTCVPIDNAQQVHPSANNGFCVVNNGRGPGCPKTVIVMSAKMCNAEPQTQPNRQKDKPISQFARDGRRKGRQQRAGSRAGKWMEFRVTITPPVRMPTVRGCLRRKCHYHHCEDRHNVCASESFSITVGTVRCSFISVNACQYLHCKSGKLCMSVGLERAMCVLD